MVVPSPNWPLTLLPQQETAPSAPITQPNRTASATRPKVTPPTERTERDPGRARRRQGREQLGAAAIWGASTGEAGLATPADRRDGPRPPLAGRATLRKENPTLPLSQTPTVA